MIEYDNETPRRLWLIGCSSARAKARDVTPVRLDRMQTNSNTLGRLLERLIPNSQAWGRTLGLARDILWPGLLSLALTGVVTACLFGVTTAIELRHVAIVYLVPVFIATLRWGVIAGMISALASVVASAFFFYAPTYNLRVSDPHHIVDLGLFLVVAVVTCHLAANIRSRENELRIRRETETFRDALIGSVSHELRTPLASIVSSTYLLAHAPAVQQDARLAALADDARHEAERLNDDIQDLLDASRITNAGIQPQLQWAEASDIVNAAVERKQRRLSSYQLVLDIPDELPLVHTDPLLIEQALVQILDNAAKYSPAGTRIVVALSGANAGLAVTVTDQGAGLTDEERIRIWERFYRSPRHLTTSTGSGLGLWIARAFVLATGGSIEAVSPGPERGTTVTIRLLAPQPNPADDEARSDE